ncbi:hypothetical protein [Burkholderia cepacia]|uniref:hypothetical protein n=1 Tax=Burkholderia cepacia TaxID=292 RepID=UPI00076C0166|nr:hypothetical protein [Burkholderia cepacia]KVQ35807.1 hypothetical protein WK03_35675 [Burkholderia cepacia]NTX17934.1 hypothetical protein [Burkholderia cepacia]
MSLFFDVRRAWEDASDKGKLGEHDEVVIPAEGEEDEFVAMPRKFFDVLVHMHAETQQKLDELKTEHSVAWFESQGLTKELESHEPVSVEETKAAIVADLEAQVEHVKSSTEFEKQLQSYIAQGKWPFTPHRPQQFAAGSCLSLPYATVFTPDLLLHHVTWSDPPISDKEGAHYSEARGVRPDVPAHLRGGTHTIVLSPKTNPSPPQPGALRTHAQRKKHTSGT